MTKQRFVLASAIAAAACVANASVAAGPPGPPSPLNVTVTNTPLPVTVTNQATDSSVPFRATLCTQGAGLPDCDTAPNHLTVPPDKRLVIEYVNANCLVLSSSAFVTSIRLTIGEEQTRYNFAPVAHANDLASYFSQQTRIYADPGDLITMGNGIIGGSGQCAIVISGTLVTP